MWRITVDTQFLPFDVWQQLLEIVGMGPRSVEKDLWNSVFFDLLTTITELSLFELSLYKLRE